MSAKQSGRSWTLERATVHRGTDAAKSNRYSSNDTTRDRKPGVGERSRSWVGGYERADGTHVEGHYRKAPKHHPGR